MKRVRGRGLVARRTCPEGFKGVAPCSSDRAASVVGSGARALLDLSTESTLPIVPRRDGRRRQAARQGRSIYRRQRRSSAAVRILDRAPSSGTARERLRARRSTSRATGGLPQAAEAGIARRPLGAAAALTAPPARHEAAAVVRAMRNSPAPPAVSRASPRFRDGRGRSARSQIGDSRPSSEPSAESRSRSVSTADRVLGSTSDATDEHAGRTVASSKRVRRRPQPPALDAADREALCSLGRRAATTSTSGGPGDLTTSARAPRQPPRRPAAMHLTRRLRAPEQPPLDVHPLSARGEGAGGRAAPHWGSRR